MSNLSDIEILQLVARGSRASLEALVRRELDFVYSCALRQARFDSHLAADITQAVFILLARKANSLGEKLRANVNLRDWLFVTTRYVAKNALKMAARRRYHEQRAAAQRAVASSDDPRTPLRDQLTPMIDEAIARLNSTDRAGVLLSFFDNKTYREVGTILGLSEEAARKRVTRAIDKMREFFASRGVTVDRAAGAVVLSSALRESASAVPSSLANAIVDGAMSVSVGATTTSYLLAEGANKMFIYAKLKLAAGAIAASVIVGGSSVALLAQTKSEKPVASASALAPAQTPSDGSAFTAKFEDGITVECLGIHKLGDDAKGWWNADGSPSTNSADPPQSNSVPADTHQMLLRVNGAPKDAGIVYFFGKSLNWSSEPARQDGAPMEDAVTVAFRADDRDTLTLTAMIAVGEWESILTAEDLSAMTVGQREQGGSIISPAHDAPNPFNNQQPGALVTVSHDVSKYESRVIAFDDNGVEHVGRRGDGAIAGAVRQGQYHFDLPVESLRSVSFQVRPYNHHATFGNLTLDPSKKTDVKVRVERK